MKHSQNLETFKEKFGKGKAYGEPSSCFKSLMEAEEYGEKVAEALSFKPGDDILELVKNLNGTIHYEGRLDFSTGSIIVHSPTDFEILLPSFTSQLRDRFTIAHELGHFVMHSAVGKKPLIAGRTANLYSADWSELEANYFAAGFLMPEGLFREKYKEYDEDINRTARYFGVSPAAARYRNSHIF